MDKFPVLLIEPEPELDGLNNFWTGYYQNQIIQFKLLDNMIVLDKKISLIDGFMIGEYNDKKYILNVKS